MKKTKDAIRKNYENHLFLLSENIDRLLKTNNTTIYKLTTSIDIDGMTTGEKQLTANLVYSFNKKLENYKKSKDKESSIPHIAYNTIVTLADYFNVPVTELVSTSQDDKLYISLYHGRKKESITISHTMFNNIQNINKLFAVKVLDSSMAPLVNINDIVFAVEENNYDIDGLYIIKNNRGMFLKRIVFYNNSVDVLSENPHYKPVSYKMQDNSLYNQELNETIYIAGKAVSFINNSIQSL